MVDECCYCGCLPSREAARQLFTLTTDSDSEVDSCFRYILNSTKKEDLNLFIPVTITIFRPKSPASCSEVNNKGCSAFKRPIRARLERLEPC